MKSFGLTDRGKIRKDNQDSFIIEKCSARNCLLLSVCDGMGGENAGSLASQLVNKAFVSYVYTHISEFTGRSVPYSEILRDACAEANGVAYEYSHFSKEYEGMGTTLVAAVVRPNGSVSLINVGDSRAYHISPRTQCIVQITRDHSYVEDLVVHGVITREQAKTHPNRNVITRALGSDPEVQADTFEFNISGGEMLLLCSDGLTNTVSDREILAAAVQSRDPERLCRQLMETALQRGARDNVTVVSARK